MCLAASAMISSRWTNASVLAVTIRLPLGWRAKAVMDRSISPTSCTLTGINARPNEGATAWMAANWPVPAYCGITKHGCSRDPRGDLYEELHPFAAHAIFKQSKSGGVATRPCQITKPAPTGPMTVTNTMSTVRVTPRNASTTGVPVARIASGASATNSAAYLRNSSGSPAPQR